MKWPLTRGEIQFSISSQHWTSSASLHVLNIRSRIDDEELQCSFSKVFSKKINLLIVLIVSSIAAVLLPFDS